ASLVVFFFQAEDGIRDPLVTGVQTCALPIWASSTEPYSLISSASWAWDSKNRRLAAGYFVATRSAGGQVARAAMAEPSATAMTRSEERRVGKECGCRGARYAETNRRSETEIQ